MKLLSILAAISALLFFVGLYISVVYVVITIIKGIK